MRTKDIGNGLMAMETAVWSGRFRGIAFEIKRCPHPMHGLEELGIHSNVKFAWTFYIFINEQSIPDDQMDRWFLEPKASEHFLDRLSFDYYESAAADLEWHGEITYYKRHTDGAGNAYIEVGCDFQHHFDEGIEYRLESVAVEVKECINSLFDQVPGLLVWDQSDGKYRPEGELKASKTKCPT